MEKIAFQPDGQDEPVEFYVLEQTRIGGTDYILVTDQEEGDGNALILKDMSTPEDEEARYEIVSDDVELSTLADIFAKMDEDIEFVSEESR